MTEKRVSIIGGEQTFAQFRAVIFTERQPSAASLVLVTKFAPFELRSAGDDFRSGSRPLRHGSVLAPLCPQHVCCHVSQSFHLSVSIFCCVFRGNVNVGWCGSQTPCQMLILA